MLGWLRFGSSLVFVVGLVGLAWWGHHTDWRFAGHGPDVEVTAAEVEAVDGRLRFGSAEAAERAGIDFSSAYVGRLEVGVTAPATVTYDPARFVRLPPRADGTLWQIRKRLGEPVKKGDVLALIDAPEVGRARIDFATAQFQVDVRTRTLDQVKVGAGVVPEARLREAETAQKEAKAQLATARGRLDAFGLDVPADALAGLTAEQVARRQRFLGLPDPLAGELDKETTTACLLPLVAPFDGEVLALDAVAGEVVAADRAVVVVGDPSRMWLKLALAPQASGAIAVGEPVRFQAADGKVDWISPSVEEATRTVEVRAVFANPDGKLRDGLRGPARVVVRVAPKALLIPTEAVGHDGDASFVLVRDPATPNLLHVRRLTVGAEAAGQVEVLAGLAAGEVVVAKGAARLFDVARRNLPAGR